MHRLIPPLLLLLAMASSCATHPEKPSSASLSSDPFVGFWANPTLCMLELTSTDGKSYQGTIWGDFSFPVQAVRDGDVLRGNVIYTIGAKEPFELRMKDGQLLLSMGDELGQHPLKRYASKAAFEEWADSQPASTGKPRVEK